MNCLDALGFSASAMAKKSGARVLGDARVEKGDVREAGAAQDERGGTREAGGVRVSHPAPLVAAIGGGGKTTLLHSLTEELREQGAHVVLATTTHFMPFDGVETVSSSNKAEVEAALARDGIVCAAAPAAGRAGAAGKLGPSPIALDELRLLADVVLVEADGSKRLPLKLHVEHEPVVPAGSACVVYVLGASGFGRPLAQACHRAELASERLGIGGREPATPELVAHLLADEIARGIVTPTHVIVNQVEDEAAREQAQAFAAELRRLGVALPVFAGSIREHELERVAGPLDK